MGKLVLFNLVEGDFQSGFHVTLQIFTEGDRRLIADTEGRLPPAAELVEHYEGWQKSYRKRVGGRSSARITAKGYTDAEILTEIRKAKYQLHSSVNSWLNPHQFDFSPIWTKILKTLKDEDEEIRVIVKTNNKKLQQMPWYIWNEFFYYYRRAEVCLYLPVKIRKPATPRDKVKVLAVLGKNESVGNNTRIRTEQDWEMLKRHLSQESNAELIRLDKPTLEDLCDQIEEQSPQILFFAGHSCSEEDEAVGLIELNQHESITIDDLAPYLREAVDRGLQLAIFNSCEGLGIARQLADWHIPNIIVMRELVPDEVAQKFLQRFLEAFAAGAPLHVAVRKAREKINYLETKFPGASWLPMIFQNPAQSSLTWEGLGGVKIGNQSNQATRASERYETERETKNQQELLVKTGTNQPNPEQQRPQQESGNSSDKIICNQGHRNPAKKKFCEHCGVRLKGGAIGVGEHLSRRYRIIEFWKDSGFSRTFIAKDTQLPGEPKCFIKQLKLDNSNSENQERIRLFKTEGEVLQKLGYHDNIPRLLAYFEEKGENYLVQEFVEGNNMSKELKQGESLGEDKVINLLKYALNILAFVHVHNVIHRDIKPANLIRRKQDSKLVLIDFGAAKKISQQKVNSQEQTDPTILIGTPSYMPREQKNGQPQFNSDIYALGKICIQALTGVQPENLQKDPNTGEISWHQRAHVTKDLAGILDKMVKEDFKDRYRSADEVLKNLDSLTD